MSNELETFHTVVKLLVHVQTHLRLECSVTFAASNDFNLRPNHVSWHVRMSRLSVHEVRSNQIECFRASLDVAVGEAGES